MQSAYVEDDAVCVGGCELRHSNTLVFLGILMGFAVTCVDVLNHRLGVAAKTFHGFYRILCRGTTPVKKRLQLLDSYITSKWRWMAPAVRPVTKVKRLLEILHLTYVCSIARLAYDPLTSASNNWVARRRASRMLAHLVGHTSWSVVQTKQFFSYWGHAARLPLEGRRPVRLAIEIFGLAWTHRHEGIVRRQKGYWPNTVRFLQLAWERVKGDGEPLFWTDLAQHRAAWADFRPRWLTQQGWLSKGMCENLYSQDLLGRQLLQVGNRFHLLPFRHYPVEEMYEAPLRVVLSAEEQMASAFFQVVTDGSSRDKVGGYAAVMMPAYGDIEMAVVARRKMLGKATNIQAELQASIQGLKMILQVFQSLGVAHFELLTDSMYVVQLLEDSITSVRHAGQAAELLALWQRLLLLASVEVKWVKGHSNHLLHDLADRHAKLSLRHRDSCVIYRHALSDAALGGGRGGTILRPPFFWSEHTE